MFAPSTRREEDGNAPGRLSSDALTTVGGSPIQAAPIAIENLTKRYGSLTAVSGLSLSVAPGEVLGFLGPNGAGKTTTIRTLMGFLNPTSGRCAVLGRWPGQDIALRRQIGYIPGDFRVDPRMTPEGLFRWYSKVRGGVDPGRVRALADRLQLETDRRFGSLSKGNRQKVALVQAFMHDPEVLIMDEPTSGLDPLLQREFRRIVLEAAQRGATVLLSSHVLPEVEHIATRIAMIRTGRLVTISTVDELLEHAHQHLELHYSSPVPDSLFAGVPGIVTADVTGTTASIVIDGPAGPAMRAAADHPGLLHIRSTSDELEDLFAELYEPQGSA
jgi:ABC-2 type transport system ATP-binding protein